MYRNAEWFINLSIYLVNKCKKCRLGKTNYKRPSYRSSVVPHVTRLRCLSAALRFLQVGVMTSDNECVCVYVCYFKSSVRECLLFEHECI